jgi:hypothetical protein
MRKLILALAVTVPALAGVTTADAAPLSGMTPATMPPAAPRNYTPVPAQYRPPLQCTQTCYPPAFPGAPSRCTQTCR